MQASQSYSWTDVMNELPDSETKVSKVGGVGDVSYMLILYLYNC